MTFGERLTLVRKRKGLSQAEVGKKIGINGDAYGRYERNEVRTTIEMAVKISEALEVSLDYLLVKLICSWIMRPLNASRMFLKCQK
jgi:transcriptional regulator with XRE-family HTH domain